MSTVEKLTHERDQCESSLARWRKGNPGKTDFQGWPLATRARIAALNFALEAVNGEPTPIEDEMAGRTA